MIYYVVWRNIMKGRADFEVNISFKVGDERRVSFWKTNGAKMRY